MLIIIHISFFLKVKWGHLGAEFESLWTDLTGDYGPHFSGCMHGLLPLCVCVCNR